jgi:hypothetical protein
LCKNPNTFEHKKSHHGGCAKTFENSNNPQVNVVVFSGRILLMSHQNTIATVELTFMHAWTRNIVGARI